MKWTSFFLTCFLAFVLGQGAWGQPLTTEKMQLEATLATPGVTLLAVSQHSDLWAAAGAQETTLFKDKSEVTKLRFWTRRPQMVFSKDEKNLYAEGLEVDIAANRVTESPTQSRWGRLVAVAAAYFPTDSDTAIVMLRNQPSKGLDREVGPIKQPQLLVVNRKNGEVIHTLSKAIDMAERMPMALHGAWVAIGYEGLQVWNWQTGESVFVETEEHAGGWEVPLAFSQDGRWLVLAGDTDAPCSIWDTHTWKRVWQGALLTGDVQQLAFSPLHTQLLAIGGPKGLSLWKLDAQGKPLPVGKKLTIPVQDLAFDHEGKRLLVASGDSTHVYGILP